MTTSQKNELLLQWMGGDAGMKSIFTEIQPPQPKVPVSHLETARMLADGRLKGMSTYVWQTRMTTVLKMLEQAQAEIRRLRGIPEPE